MLPVPLSRNLELDTEGVFGRVIFQRPRLQEIHKTLMNVCKILRAFSGESVHSFQPILKRVYGQKRLKKTRKTKGHWPWLNNLRWLFHLENYWERRLDLFARARSYWTLKTRQRWLDINLRSLWSYWKPAGKITTGQKLGHNMSCLELVSLSQGPSSLQSGY